MAVGTILVLLHIDSSSVCLAAGQKHRMLSKGVMQCASTQTVASNSFDTVLTLCVCYVWVHIPLCIQVTTI